MFLICRSRCWVSEVRSAQFMPFLDSLRSEAIEIQIGFRETIDCAFNPGYCRHNVITQFRDFFEYIWATAKIVHLKSRRTLIEARRMFALRITKTCSTHFVTCAPMGNTTIHKWIKLAHTHKLCQITNNWLILIWL